MLYTLCGSGSGSISCWRGKIPRCHTRVHGWSTRKRSSLYNLHKSRLECYCAVYDPHYTMDIGLLVSVQRKGVTHVKNNYVQPQSVTNMVKELNWPILKDRRRDIRPALLLKIIKGKVTVEVEDIFVKAASRTGSHHSHNFRHWTAKTTQYKMRAATFPIHT